MKNIIAKVVGASIYMADYFINHPKLGIARIMLRMMVTVGFVCLICLMPVMYVIDIIFTWCDNTFKDDSLEVKDEWK